MEGRHDAVEEFWVRIMWFEHATNALEHIPRTCVGT